jgi:citrate/tricarballylate utilization protein
MPLDELVAEAQRQLNVCNSCRYCEGYCPVWPALELRTVLTAGDVTHLSNLCHDCRDCFTACMYTAPHEFDLNPPQLFTQVRERTYRDYVWPHRVPSWLGGRLGGRLAGRQGGRLGLVVWFLAVSGLLAVLSVITTGADVFAAPGAGSPYALIPHLLMVAIVTVPSLFTVVVLGLAVTRYWHDTHGSLRHLGRIRIWGTAIYEAAQLRHLRGGGEQCAYPDDLPGPARRRYHLGVSYGFGLGLISTGSAAFMQQVLGIEPPYSYLSVPVVTGTAGGLGMVGGCLGLIVLKSRSDRELGTESMRRADYGLLWALLILAVSGLLTLFLRTTVLFGPALVAHLAAVIVAFAVAPYTKFVHWIYRLLAIYKSHLDMSAS